MRLARRVSVAFRARRATLVLAEPPDRRARVELRAFLVILGLPVIRAPVAFRALPVPPGVLVRPDLKALPVLAGCRAWPVSTDPMALPVPRARLGLRARLVRLVFLVRVAFRA
ncbi:MAG: hypothetical protein ACR2JI_05100 [Mycobacterium sp.]